MGGTGLSPRFICVLFPDSMQRRKKESFSSAPYGTVESESECCWQAEVRVGILQFRDNADAHGVCDS